MAKTSMVGSVSPTPSVTLREGYSHANRRVTERTGTGILTKGEGDVVLRKLTEKAQA